MSLQGFLRVSDFKAAVRRCSDGGDVRLSRHRWIANANGKTAFLVKGKHGRDPEIRLKKILAAVEQLELDRQCVEKRIPALAGHLG